METIQIYLDSVFASAPDTEEVRRVKAELLANMEEKYAELKAAGASENEAVGSVISDFGNVEELFAALGIVLPGAVVVSGDGVEGGVDPEQSYPLLATSRADQFVEVMRRSARGIGGGVLLVLIAVAQLVLFGGLIAARAESITTAEFAPVAGLDLVISQSDGGPGMIIPLLVFFALLIPAVGLIIYNALQLQGFDEIDKGTFRLDYGLSTRLRLEVEQRRGGDNRRIVTGVTLIMTGVLCVLLSSLPALFAPSEGVDTALFGVAILLILVGIAARIFILFGMERSAYDKLLKTGDYAPEKRRNDQLVEAVSAFYWPCTVALYLLWSFTTGAWDKTWIIWPVAGVLFGALAALLQLAGRGRSRG